MELRRTEAVKAGSRLRKASRRRALAGRQNEGRVRSVRGEREGGVTVVAG